MVERRYRATWSRSRRGEPRRLVEAVTGPPGAAALAAVATGMAVAVDMGAFDWASTVHGWVIDVTVGLALAGLLAGVAGRDLRWWRTWGAAIAAAAGATVIGIWWWLRASGTVPEIYPQSFLLWVWLALVSVGVALTGWWSGRALTRVARVLTAPLALVAALFLIDAHYGYWPTVAALLHRPVVGQVATHELLHQLQVPARPATAAAIHGEYGRVTIPAGRTDFQPAPAYVWLPPDFFHTDRRDESVLLMLPGWPGNVEDWVRAGGAVTLANRWADAHHGAAPVMVFVDENGVHSDDTECVDGPAGDAESYLVDQVPHFIEHVLGIPSDPRRWGVVGFSEGGTCAALLSEKYPNLFGRAVDIAGDIAPNYGIGLSKWQTLNLLFGGDAMAERANTPLLVLAHRHYVGDITWFTVGHHDVLKVRVARRLAAASARSGITVHLLIMPGRHTWIFAGRALAVDYPALVGALGASDDGNAFSPVPDLLAVRQPRHPHQSAACGSERLTGVVPHWMLGHRRADDCPDPDVRHGDVR